MNFILDENMPQKLAKGLEVLDQENSFGINVKITHSTEIKKGATDEEIIKIAGRKDAIIISQDDDFKRIKSNKLLVKQLKVGYVLYKPPNKTGTRYWEIVKSFILGWEHLKEKIRETEKPFIIIINKKGEISHETF